MSAPLFRCTEKHHYRAGSELFTAAERIFSPTIENGRSSYIVNSFYSDSQVCSPILTASSSFYTIYILLLSGHKTGTLTIALRTSKQVLSFDANVFISC